MNIILGGGGYNYIDILKQFPQEILNIIYSKLNSQEKMKQLNEVARMQQLAGINEIKVNNPNNNDNQKLAIFLNKNIEKIKELIPDEDFSEVKFEYWGIEEVGGNESEIGIYCVNKHDGEVEVPIIFNTEPKEFENGGGGSDTPISIDDVNFYYGYFNY